MYSRNEKRLFEGTNDRDGLQEDKRPKGPVLSNAVVEAVKADSLQKLCSSLEPMLRRVVGEEIEKALARLAPQHGQGRVVSRSSPKRSIGPDEKHLRLQFRSKLALPLFTGSKVEGEAGSAIHVVLQDESTGQVITSGTGSNVKLEVVVLEGDFSVDDEQTWSQDDFEQNIVRERDGKRPLLAGDLTVTLKDGVGSLGELTFTDNSSWIRSRKFRLGVRLASGQMEGVRVREAKTEAFTVKDHRGELYKKHYPPALHDEVWRLDRIGKDGAFHKRLNQAGIFTVEDFLRLVVMDPQKLRNILGSGMSNKMWEGTVEHAKTCVLNGKLHVYYADDKQNIGVIFNNIFQLMGLIADGQYMSVDLLSESEKIYVDKLVKVAYENWENVVEYDGEALIGVKPYNLRGINAMTEDPVGQQSARNSNGAGGGGGGGGDSRRPRPPPSPQGLTNNTNTNSSGNHGHQLLQAHPHHSQGYFQNNPGGGGGGGGSVGVTTTGKANKRSSSSSVLPGGFTVGALQASSSQAGASRSSGGGGDYSSDREDEDVEGRLQQQQQQEPVMQLGLGQTPVNESQQSQARSAVSPNPFLSTGEGPSSLELGTGGGQPARDDSDSWGRPIRPLAIGASSDVMKSMESELASAFDPDDMTEEELRAKSLEMLMENDDMHLQLQQLLEYLEPNESGGFELPKDLPFNHTQLSTEPGKSGKASMGWLKLKAILHWNIFARKKAAERREKERLQELGNTESSNV